MKKLSAVRHLNPKSKLANDNILFFFTAEGGQKQPTKRRKRKTSTAASENNSKLGNPGAVDRPNKRKASPITSGRGSITTDVMLVGEPTLMGGEFGAEDERIITRYHCIIFNRILVGGPPNLPPPPVNCLITLSGEILWPLILLFTATFSATSLDIFIEIS